MIDARSPPAACALGISSDAFPPGPSLLSAWRATAARLPDKTALICGDDRVSHTELARRVAVLARAMKQAGVEPGDRVVLLLDNGIGFATAMLAVLHLEAVFVPLSPLTRAAKLAFVLGDTQASALLTQASLESVWHDVLATAVAPRAIVAMQVDRIVAASPPENKALADPGLADQAPRDAHEAREGKDALAALIYTSGTTGQPKGVMLGHGNMRAAWRSVQSYLQLREDDVIGLALPMAFSYGLYHLIMAIGTGATLVIERSAAFPVVLLKRWAEHHVTVFPGVPTLFASLLTQDLSKYDLGALRIVTNAAAALPPAHLDRLRQAWPQARLFAMYGLTECKRASYLPPEELDRRAGSVGRGLPGQRHWLVDDAGSEVVPGGTGQLVVAGPHVMQGYWRRPAETAEKLRPAPDGTPALYTGDLFRSDADGYLYFVSRTDDIIKSRGEKVSPLEVEHAICELPGVVDAAVAGMPDPLLGQAILAHVKLAPGAIISERDVIRHCLARLESFMAPKAVRFVDELPLTDSGKLRRASLDSMPDGPSAPPRTPPSSRNSRPENQ